MFATDIHKLQILNDLIGQTLEAIERRSALWGTQTPFTAVPQAYAPSFMHPMLSGVLPQMMQQGTGYGVPQYGVSQYGVPQYGQYGVPQYGVTQYGVQQSFPTQHQGINVAQGMMPNAYSTGMHPAISGNAVRYGNGATVNAGW